MRSRWIIQQNSKTPRVEQERIRRTTKIPKRRRTISLAIEKIRREEENSSRVRMGETSCEEETNPQDTTQNNPASANEKSRCVVLGSKAKEEQ